MAQSLSSYSQLFFGDDAAEETDAAAPALPRGWFPLAGIIGLVLLGCLLGWAVTMTVLYADTQNGGHHNNNTVRDNICTHVPSHAIIADDACIFSSRTVLEAHEAILTYTGDWHFCGYWLLAGDWSLFTGGTSWSTWGTTATTNPLIAAFEQLNATVQHAMSLHTTTFTERATFEVQLRELSLLPELARLHNYHTGTFDAFWVGSVSAPPTCLSFFSVFLPFFAMEPDYDTKSLTFMNNLLVAMQDMNDYYPQALDANILWFNDSAANTWYEDWAFAAAPGTSQPICDAMTNATIKAACDAIVPQIDAEFATLEDIMVNQWIPACNAAFNYDSTGRVHLTNGVDAAYVWTNYFYGPATATEQREAVAMRDAYSYQQLQDLLDVYYPGTTVPQWQARLNDLNDPDIWLCAPTTGPINDRTQLMWGNATRWSQQIMGYGAFDVPRAVFTADLTASAFYSKGQWNSIELLWDVSSTITYGIALNGSLRCFPNYEYRLVDHEGVFGHARQVPLVLTTQCRGDPIPWLLSTTLSYIEGIAVYGESVAYQDTTMVVACPRCAMSTLVTTLYANAGSMFDFAFFGNLTFTECLSISLASGAYPTPSQAYQNCYRSMNSMQRSSYIAPAKHLADLRALAEAALGADFEIIHWHKFIHRVGLLPWSDIDHMTNVYIKWRLGDETAADMPGYDYLVCQLFGNTWVTTLGVGHLPIYDDTLGSNPTHIAGLDPFVTIQAAAETDTGVAATLQRLYAKTTVFVSA